jgi:hypothetical protein
VEVRFLSGGIGRARLGDVPKGLRRVWRKSENGFCGVFGQRRLFNGLFPFPKKNPAISGRKNGVLLLAKKHAVSSVFFA